MANLDDGFFYGQYLRSRYLILKYSLHNLYIIKIRLTFSQKHNMHFNVFLYFLFFPLFFFSDVWIRGEKN